MNESQTFEAFLKNYTPEISPLGFVINLILTGLFAFVLGRLYMRYGGSLSNKKSFAANFELIALTTMVIITIVKSSLALSLGLVGALSIVRFRAAIKEPEELAYIFFCIALGLGFGADQRVVTIIGFFFVFLVIILKNFFKPTASIQNLNFTILADKSLKLSLDTIINSISPYCKGLELKRFDENNNFMEASFLIEFDDYKELTQARDALYQLDESIQINFLDHKGIF